MTLVLTASHASRIFSGIPLMKSRNSDSTIIRNCSDNLPLQASSNLLISSESRDPLPVVKVECMLCALSAGTVGVRLGISLAGDRWSL